MAKGATIEVNVPESVAGQIRSAVTAVKKLNMAMLRLTQVSVAARVAMTGSTKVTSQMRNALASTAGTLATYTSGVVGSSMATSKMTATMKSAAAWTRKMGIGLYVIGGAATSVARPLMALSMIFENYETMQWSHEAIDGYMENLKGHLRTLRERAVNAFQALGRGLRRAGSAVLSAAKRVPILGSAIKTLTGWVNGLNMSLGVLATYLTAGVFAVFMAAKGMKSVADKFAPVSEHLQRAISVSALTQDQFDDLTLTLFKLQRQIGAFTTEELANMIERMAYAGAIGEGFEETARAIGQIARVTGMEIAEITRDMSRLTSQTGESYKAFANVILRTFSQASITYEETVESFQQAGMLLREDLGMNISELGAIVVQLEKFGYTGTRAATAVRSLAARSSELKEGLRGSQEIFRELGVQDAVKDFQEGRMALDELIKTFGEAGASYGHMVNIFNRRAGVAAAAIAEFADEYEKATDKIQDTSKTVTQMFDELASTYKGHQRSLEATRSRAVQRWAFTFRKIGKGFMIMNKQFWNFVDFAGRIAYKFPAAFQVIRHSWGIMTSHMDQGFVDLMNNVNFIFEKILHGAEMVFGAIPGFGDKIVNKLQTARQTMKGWRKMAEKQAQEAIEGHKEGLSEAWKNLFGQPSVEVLKNQRRQQKMLEEANKSFEEQISDNIKALQEFRTALQPKFIERLFDEITGLVTQLEFAKENMSLYLEEMKKNLHEARVMGTPDSLKMAFQGATQRAMTMITNFAKLGQVSTYLEKKFKDVREELEEMFGTTRTINRRHAAVVQETGKMIGQVKGLDTGGLSDKAQQIKEMVGPEQFRFFQEMVNNMGDMAKDFDSIVMDVWRNMDIEGATGEDIWNKLLERAFPEDWDVSEQFKEQEIMAMRSVKDAYQSLFPEGEAPAYDELNKTVQNQIERLGVNIANAIPDEADVQDVFPGGESEITGVGMPEIDKLFSKDTSLTGKIRNLYDWLAKELSKPQNTITFNANDPVRALKMYVIEAILEGKDVPLNFATKVENLKSSINTPLGEASGVTFDIAKPTSNLANTIAGKIVEGTDVNFDTKSAVKKIKNHVIGGTVSGESVPYNTEDPVKGLRKHVITGILSGKVPISTLGAVQDLREHSNSGVLEGTTVDFSTIDSVKDLKQYLNKGAKEPIGSITFDLVGTSQDTVDYMSSGLGSVQDSVSFEEYKKKAKSAVSHVTEGVGSAQDVSFESIPKSVRQARKHVAGGILGAKGTEINLSPTVKGFASWLVGKVESGEIEEFNIKQTVTALKDFLKKKVDSGKVKELKLKSTVVDLASDLRTKIASGEDPTFAVKDVVESLRDTIQKRIKNGEIKNFDVKKFVKNFRKYLKGRVESGELDQFDIKTVVQELRGSVIGPISDAKAVPFDAESPTRGFKKWFIGNITEGESVEFDTKGKVQGLQQYVGKGLAPPEKDIFDVSGSMSGINTKLNKELDKIEPDISPDKIKKIKSAWKRRLNALGDALSIDQKSIDKLNSQVERLEQDVGGVIDTIINGISNLAPSSKPDNNSTPTLKLPASSPDSETAQMVNKVKNEMTGAADGEDGYSVDQHGYPASPIEKIVTNKSTRATHVTVNQRTQPEFTIEISGVEDTGDLEERIRFAISRAMTRLNADMKSGVDPQALERAVNEILEGEMEEGG